MFGRNEGIKSKVVHAAESAKGTVVDTAGAAAAYVDPLAKDEKLRQRLAAALTAGAAARRRARRQTGLTGLARRLATDRTLRAQLQEAARQLQGAQKRAKKARSHRLRNTMLVVAGVSAAVAAVRHFTSTPPGDPTPPDGAQSL